MNPEFIPSTILNTKLMMILLISIGFRTKTINTGNNLANFI